MTRTSLSTKEKFGTLSEQQASLLRLLLEDKSRRTQAIKPRSRGAITGRSGPTSWAQESLWFIEQLEGASSAYHISKAVRLRGELDKTLLHRALSSLVQRHEVLRTVFVTLEGKPLQEVKTDCAFALQTIDLTGATDVAREALVSTHRDEEARKAFDLETGPLIRGRLLRLSPDEHVMLITMHHIVSDGWSMEIFVRELSEIYRAYVNDDNVALPVLPIQYADYAQWQHASLQGKALERRLSYWRTHLTSAAPRLELPTDRPRPLVQSHRGDTLEFRMDASLTASLKSFALRHEMTLFMLLYAGWAILLSRLSGQSDVVIGTPVANRQRPELERLMGLFVNTVVLRATVDENSLVEELLAQVKEVTLGAYDHQDVPFEQVVEALRPQRSLSHHPLFQVMLVVQNVSREALDLPGLSVQTEACAGEPAKFDLLLALEEHETEIVGNANYAVDLFDRATVERWMACFTILLQQLIVNEKSHVGSLSMLSTDERERVIEHFNATDVPYPREKLIHQIFEEQVAQTPDAVAVTYEERSIRYGELNRAANKLARYLVAIGVQAGDRIPIRMMRGLRMLIAQLAVLKSGGVYVPLDPDLPEQRQLVLIKDCGARHLLTEETVAELCELEFLRQVDWASAEALADSMSEDNLQLIRVEPSIAYIMYTSGSTGVPKGVLVPHRAVNRLVINNGYARINATDCIAHCSNPAFDASTFEIWGALLNGASVLIVPQAVVLEPDEFVSLLMVRRVSVLWLTVGLLVRYIDALRAVFGQLKYLMTGGDVVDPVTARRVMERDPPRYFLNCYGPTECTTFATTHTVEAIRDDAVAIPIGRPIGNTRLYVLDRGLQPVPIGIQGEIYIGGDGVAQGYLNQPELTTERFVPDPFNARPLAKMYRTGDLGRWNADGEIEYFGRNDNQVKVRGFRIELGEISGQLARHARVRDAVVVIREDDPGEKRLVAYVVPRETATPEEAVSAEILRAYLDTTLPDYMVPGAFVMVERMPLTINGKLDRAALPLPERAAYVNRHYTPPEGEIELQLAGIWAELLNLERVGRQDNFFDLGGHSLLALVLQFRVNKAFDVALTVKDTYRTSSLAELASLIGGTSTVDSFVDLAREAVLDDTIRPKSVAPARRAKAILMTGCTGFVGRFLLAQLLRDTDATVYCLVRAKSPRQAMERITATLLKWNLWSDGFESRIVAVPGDMGALRLGLDDEMYQTLSNEVDSIYHCATSMNHLETYEMAKLTNVRGTEELLKLATRNKPKLLNYISTLSVFSSVGHNASRVAYEDSSIVSERHSLFDGYAASKWVGEKMIMTAGERGIPCNIFRLGLVLGDTEQGRYDPLQREYRILKSGFLIGCGIENYRYELAPTPVNYVARSVVFLSTQNAEGHGIFHISSSSQNVEGLFECCNAVAATSLDLVPLYEWIRKLRQLHDEGRSLPAVPLMEFAFSMDEASFVKSQGEIGAVRTRFDCSKTHRALERAGIIAPVFDEALLKVYVDGMFAQDAELRDLHTLEGVVQ